MEEILSELKLQTDLLRNIGRDISGLRNDIKEGQESGVKHSMEQALSALKGTPFEGIMASMMAKAGGPNGK